MTFDAPTRALLAGALWLTAGLGLLWRGLDPYWLNVAQESILTALLLLAGAVLIGAAKGWFVLRRSAIRILQHIESRPGQQGLAAVYPASALPLLLLMIALGFAMRHFLGESYPEIVAGVYLGIGAALICSTSPFVRFWRCGVFGTAEVTPS
ncbi:MAG: hypothetical protein AAF648_08805 [Pseudomonadota bacterium]